MACSFKHEDEFKPTASRVSVLRFEAGVSVPLTCLQCDEPYCMAVCKTGAIDKDADSGLVSVDGTNVSVAVCV